jgi:hypothetical protein
MTTASAPAPVRSGQVSNRIGQAVGRRLLPVFTIIAICYLLIPIFVMIIFSFND